MPRSICEANWKLHGHAWSLTLHTRQIVKPWSASKAAQPLQARQSYASMPGAKHVSRLQGKPLHRCPYLVGKTPEQQRHDHGSPKLSHDIEQAEGPVAHDGDRAGKAGTHLLQQPLRQCCIGDTQLSDLEG